MNTENKLNLVKQIWKQFPGRYFKDCLKIQHKETIRVVPFELNRHQQIIQEAIDDQRRQGKPVRIQILKPRQTGISTVSLANLFHSVRFRKGTAMVVSKDGDSSEHLHTINQRFHNYLPKQEKLVLQTVASNRKELKFKEPHGGRILVETAGKESGGHSFTIHHLLLSEGSRWPDGCDDTRAGLLAAVPNTSDTLIIKESVANGMSGKFYQEWGEGSDYAKVFLPWSAHDEYSLPLPLQPEAAYLITLTEEEKQLMGRHQLSLEQIEWRRWAIREVCDGDKDKFREQYPLTASEAFIASGNSFFHIPILEAIEPVEGMRCDLREFEHPRSHQKEIKPVDNPRGWLWLNKRPEPGHSYVWGADVAEGITIDGAPADDRRDHSSADIIDRHTGEQVAHLHAQITPDEFGRQLVLLCKYYNNAYGSPEMNAGYGPHVLDTMQKENYPAHLFYREPGTDQVGWKTKPSNKKSLCSNLDMALRSLELKPKNKHTLQELKAFITKQNGKLEGGQGHKDDRVISLAIANHMLKVAPPMDLFVNQPQSQFQPISYRPHRSIYARRAALI